MNGTILNIQRFCTDDGPGIRTTVFLKGCPLKCLWCHNPETQSRHAEIMYNAEKCTSCGACAAICPNECHSVGGVHDFSREKCTGCGACAAKCPTGAIELCGQILSADEVLSAVKKDKIFYETSGGGVTVSGGEPLFQPEFTSAILKACRESGISTAIETCGFASEDALLSVIEHCDLVLFDIKETDEDLHKQYTGAPLSPILKNLSIINDKKIPFIIRAPIIPSLNDREAHFDGLRALRDSLEFCRGIQVMPYHEFGAHKHEMLQREYACDGIAPPTDDTAELWRRKLEFNN